MLELSQIYLDSILTIRELKQWLEQFPEDALVQIKQTFRAEEVYWEEATEKTLNDVITVDLKGKI